MSRMERKKEKTKQQIITVAITLFTEYGFDRVTMEQIADQADVAKGTLYNYFPAKEAILDEYVQRSFQQRNPNRVLDLRQIPTTRARMRIILGELMDGVQAQKDIFERYFAYRIQKVISLRKDEHEASGFDRLAVEIIRLGQETGELRADLPLDMLVGLFEYVFVTVARQYYLEPEDFNVQQAIEQGIDLFMNGTAPKER